MPCGMHGSGASSLSDSPRSLARMSASSSNRSPSTNSGRLRLAMGGTQPHAGQHGSVRSNTVRHRSPAASLRQVRSGIASDGPDLVPRSRASSVQRRGESGRPCRSHCPTWSIMIPCGLLLAAIRRRRSARARSPHPSAIPGASIRRSTRPNCWTNRPNDIVGRAKLTTSQAGTSTPSPSTSTLTNCSHLPPGRNSRMTRARVSGSVSPDSSAAGTPAAL